MAEFIRNLLDKVRVLLASRKPTKSSSTLRDIERRLIELQSYFDNFDRLRPADFYQRVTNVIAAAQAAGLFE